MKIIINKFGAKKVQQTSGTKNYKLMCQERLSNQLLESSKIKESWNLIKYKGIQYYVSDFGRIMSKTGRILKTYKMDNGYMRFKGTTVHRLVAYAFGLLDSLEYDHVYDVDHIDNNRRNNKLSNLQVITHQENIKKRDETGEGKHHNIDCYDRNGNYIKSFYSIKEAANELNLCSSNICNVVKGNLPHTGGYVFK